MLFSKRSALAVPLLITVLLASTFAEPAHARLVRKPKKKASSHSTAHAPLVFRSHGTVSGGGKDRRRDRTITMTRAGDQVQLEIQDHVDGTVTRGAVAMAPDRRLVTDQPELLNAANIVSVTPSVLRALKAGREEIVTEGQVEANGKVYACSMTHSLGAAGEDGTTEVVTNTDSDNGKLHFETRATVDANGIPVSARIHGRVKVFVFGANVDLTLERVSGQAL
jgi:hypothetical protein